MPSVAGACIVCVCVCHVIEDTLTLSVVMLLQGDCAPSVAGACCSRLSTLEYESEGASASQNALLGLLDTIIADQGMSSKDKRHRLKDVR